VDYSEEHFRFIEADYHEFAKKIGLKNVTFLPVSALTGENVVNKSTNFAWFEGPTLYDFLENVEIPSENITAESRFQVQYVIRPQTTELHDYRGYSGTLLSGKLAKGEEVRVLPQEFTTTIEKIEKFQIEVDEARAGEPIVIHLKDDLDVSRGSTIVRTQELPNTENEIQATICWMDNKVFQKGQKLLLQQSGFGTKASIKLSKLKLIFIPLMKLKVTVNCF
jgi:sulfate adenylyltransferase subunit 1